MARTTTRPHPAPVEARLLQGRRPAESPRPLADRGVALPASLSTPSPLAAVALGDAVSANPGAAQVRTLPRRSVDQRDTECCVSCALGAAMEVRQPEWPVLSPMFHYHVTRFRNAGADAEGRLFLVRGVGTLTVQGICREQDHASLFTPEGIARVPSDDAERDARQRQLPRDGFFHRYRRIGGTSRTAEIRRHLRADQPVVITFTLPEGYPATFLDARHQWRAEGARASSSRHCVLIIGFDDVRGAVRIFDSHGNERFDGGMWWMDYRIVDGSLVHEAYAFT